MIRVCAGSLDCPRCGATVATFVRCDRSAAMCHPCAEVALEATGIEAERVEGVVITVSVIDGASDTPVHTIEISTRADHGLVEGQRVAVVALPATGTKEG